MLTFVVPVAFLAYFPAAVLTGRSRQLAVPSWLAVASPLVGLAAFLAARQLFRRGLRSYTGIGG